MSALDAIRVAWHSLKSAKAAALHTWRGERAALANIELVRNSEFFDADWYLKNNPDVEAAGMDPARHYALHGVASNRNPSLSFVNEEYFALHNDVRAAKMNPLIHYEKYGKREGRQISLTEVEQPVFPEGCMEGEWRFDRAPRRCARTAVVAAYFGKGVIPEKLMYLLRGLKEVVDNIVLVGDCLVLPGEAGKLRGVVTVAKFERHCQYDFGSYRRGLAIARAEGLLDAAVADELVVINDSNYGPVFPFSESFGKMAAADCDFWGYTGYNAFGNIHISSYFYVFRRRVLDGTVLDGFLDELKGPVERDKVIVKFEFKLTKYLEDSGFKWTTLVPMGFRRGAPSKYPLSLCERFRAPLLKVKAVDGDSYEDVGKVLELVKKVNPSLAALIEPRSLAREHKIVTYAGHQAGFPAKCARLCAKMKAGGRARAVFFVSSASMFPARPLFDAMLADAAFDPYVVVVPDLRWRDGKTDEAMASCRDGLAAVIPADRLSLAWKDEFGMWTDVLAEADIVCYPSPYEMSSFRYNPRYSVGRDFLPICVNYGYYRSIYDRHVMGGQSYAYMWKAFFECDDTLAEYRAYSAIGGTNGDLCGYIKMDGLAAVSPVHHARRRILIAPHHSVEGGTNKMLSLANFARYADFFMELPDRYPQYDFVFRPHPFLFKIMSDPKRWGPVRVDRYIEELRAKPNVIWSDGGDYFKEFAESDGCIQDCGSYLVEYLYTGKPCCYMLKSPQDIEEKFAPLGRKCLDACYIAYDTAAIDSFLRDVIAGGRDVKAAKRAELAKSVMLNHPRAAAVALEHIKRDIFAAAPSGRGSAE